MADNQRKKWKFAISVLVICVGFVVFCAVSYSEQTVQALSDQLIRLHIIANSDEKIDQEIKLEVRDAVLQYLTGKLDLSNSTEDSEAIIQQELPNIQKIAATVLEENGLAGEAGAEYGTYLFPTKRYENIELPAGTYHALRVTLGKGEGRNWWCVVFPPLCFADSQNGVISEEADAKLKESLPAEQYDLITSTEQGHVPVQFKLKVVEVIEEAKSALFGWWDSIFG